MTWQSEWTAISNQIQGLIDAGHLLLQSPKTNEVATKEILKPHSELIYQNIQNFLNIDKPKISEAAIKCIEKFLDDYQKKCSKRQWADVTTVVTALVLLASFRSEMTYHLSDIQAVTKHLTERAIIHLQRSIVADPDVEQKWKKAFKAGETQCEKLGANHLLLHGVWAFKASEKGERTDLVLGEPLQNLDMVQSVSQALVLTEWKVIRNENELKKLAEKALKQARRYSKGILSGFELANYRYLVLVSEKNIDKMPSDVLEDQITYKYYNIAVNPSVPSKS